MKTQYLLKLFQELGEGEIRVSSGGGEFKYDIFDCQNLCKCHNVTQPSTTMKRKKKKGICLSK
jgi:hypothetical protein